MQPHYVKSTLALAIGAALTYSQTSAAAFCGDFTNNRVTEAVAIAPDVVLSGCFSNVEEVLLGQNMNGDMVAFPFAVNFPDNDQLTIMPGAPLPPGDYLLELRLTEGVLSVLLDSFDLTIPETAGPTGPTGPTGPLWSLWSFRPVWSYGCNRSYRSYGSLWSFRPVWSYGCNRSYRSYGSLWSLWSFRPVWSYGCNRSYGSFWSFWSLRPLRSCWCYWSYWSFRSFWSYGCSWSFWSYRSYGSDWSFRSLWSFWPCWCYRTCWSYWCYGSCRSCRSSRTYWSYWCYGSLRSFRSFRSLRSLRSCWSCGCRWSRLLGKSLRERCLQRIAYQDYNCKLFGVRCGFRWRLCA